MKVKRWIYILLGVVCTSLGAIGVVIPGLPTTPLLLAASWFFYRSSPRLQERLLGSSLAIYIRRYQEQGGMRPRTKAWVVCFMTAMVCCSILLFIHNTIVDWIVGIAGVVGCVVVIFFVPTAKREEKGE